MAEISKESCSAIECPCGCNKSYPIYSGWLEYGDSAALAFRAAHFSHAGQTSNLWLLLGTGPWSERDDIGCWTVLKSWNDGENLVLKVVDPDNSPFEEEHVYGERFLSRAEVLEKDGGLEWAVDRRSDILQLHKPSAAFLEITDA